MSELEEQIRQSLRSHAADAPDVADVLDTSGRRTVRTVRPSQARWRAIAFGTIATAAISVGVALVFNPEAIPPSQEPATHSSPGTTPTNVHTLPPVDSCQVVVTLTVGSQSTRFGASRSQAPTVRMRTGQTATVNASGPCSDDVSIPAPDGRVLAGTSELRPGHRHTFKAIKPGTTQLDALLPMCAPEYPPDCLGGIALVGAVRVAVSRGQ